MGWCVAMLCDISALKNTILRRFSRESRRADRDVGLFYYRAVFFSSAALAFHRHRVLICMPVWRGQYSGV